MPDMRLLAALNASTKALEKENKEEAELGFIVKHRKMFCDSNSVFYDTMNALSRRSGDALLAALGYSNMFIRKVLDRELLAACYSLRDSALFKTFVNMSTKYGKQLTVIFVAGKRAIVVSNVYSLVNSAGVMHTIASNDDNVPSLQWAAIVDMKGYTFYG